MLKLKLSELKKLEWNPRTIKKEDLDKLTKSIEKFWVIEWRPFLVSNRTGENIIIWGNQRYEVCKKLGIKEVPVHIMEWISEEEEKEIIIRDNISNWEWDWDILANEWDKEELEEWGLDVQFETVEPEAEEDDFEVDEGIKTDILLWDLFEIWSHRLLCWDSTNIDDVNKLMNGEKADMVFTDPPYWMNLDTDYSDIYKNAKSKTKNQDKVIWDDEYFDPTFLLEMSNEVFLWWADYFCQMLPLWWSWFVWDKKIWEWKIWNEFELCWSKQKHKKSIIENEWAWFRWMSKSDWNRVHPTQKPIELCSFFIKEYVEDKNIVLDLFWWSGSTMVACHQLNRRCFMSELDPKYVQTIINRMIKLDSTLEIKRNWQPYLIG